jgi:hypothetical protein
MDSNDRNNPRPRQKTNSEKVTEYLELGSPVRQALMMDAMQKQTQQILDHKDELRQSMRYSFINPDAWIQAAEDWQKLNS